MLALPKEGKQALEACLCSNGTVAVVRLRYQIIALKAQSRSAAVISAITGACTNSIYSWVKRYKQEGISGLLTREGRGRKKILRPEEDAPCY